MAQKNSYLPYEIFTLKELSQINSQTPYAYYNFFETNKIFAGLLELQKGEIDNQQPHKMDEFYVVMEGVAKLKVSADTLEVSRGDVIFVRKEVEHKFFNILKPLKVLVFFTR